MTESSNLQGLSRPRQSLKAAAALLPLRGGRNLLSVRRGQSPAGPHKPSLPGATPGSAICTRPGCGGPTDPFSRERLCAAHFEMSMDDHRWEDER